MVMWYRLEQRLDGVLMENVEALIYAQRYDFDAVVEDVMTMATDRERGNCIDSNIWKLTALSTINGVLFIERGDD